MKHRVKISPANPFAEAYPTHHVTVFNNRDEIVFIGAFNTRFQIMHCWSYMTIDHRTIISGMAEGYSAAKQICAVMGWHVPGVESYANALAEAAEISKAAA